MAARQLPPQLGPDESAGAAWARATAPTEQWIPSPRGEKVMTNNDDIRAAMEAVQARPWPHTTRDRLGPRPRPAKPPKPPKPQPPKPPAPPPPMVEEALALIERAAAADARGARDERADKTHLGRQQAASAR
jgi:hypothetical protein